MAVLPVFRMSFIISDYQGEYKLGVKMGVNDVKKTSIFESVLKP
jgi:hypothetical protein